MPGCDVWIGVLVLSRQGGGLSVKEVMMMRVQGGFAGIRWFGREVVLREVESNSWLTGGINKNGRGNIFVGGGLNLVIGTRGGCGLYWGLDWI